MELLNYETSGIDERILRAVKEMGFETMTPIQAQAIPVLLEGRDVIGQAQTGTGKTAAFGIPMLERIQPENKNLQGVILCPTRELAIQAAEEMRRFAKYTHGIKVLPVYGGQDISRQIKGLKGAQIIVGTPGRVMDHMRRHTLKMQDVSMVVLDEADEMLNMGFREDMEVILKEIPDGHQTALFSATMPKAILEITNQYQQDAVLVKVVEKELTIPLIKQYYYLVKQPYKADAVGRLLEYYGLTRSLIFCNTKKMVDELSKELQNRGYSAEGLHGDLTQNQRDSVMGRFRGGSLEILIATDVAARGIDIDDVEAVFNYDIPQDIEYYVHRIGRTGRAGREGMSFTFASNRELYKIREIERSCRTKMKEQPIPTASDTMAVKAKKALNQALETWNQGECSKWIPFIEKKLEGLPISALELAAAFLKMNVGEELKEIPKEAPRTNTSRGSSSKGGRSRYASALPVSTKSFGKRGKDYKKPAFEYVPKGKPAPGRKPKSQKGPKDIRRDGRPYYKKDTYQEKIG